MRTAILIALLAVFLVPAAASPEAFRLAGVVIGPAVAEDVYGTTAVAAEVRLAGWRYGDAPWRPEIVAPAETLPAESLAVSFAAGGRPIGHLAPGGAVAAAESLALASGEGRAVTAEVRAGPIPAGERREFALIVDLEVSPAGD